MIAHFIYINRVVDALGCDFEPEWQQSRSYAVATENPANG